MSTGSAIDLTAALERIDGDQELFLTLAEMFIGRAMEDTAAIRTALQAQDLVALAKQAHRLKGSAMEFCAHQTVAAAKSLEEAARGGKQDQVIALCERVEAEIGRLTEELRCIMEKGFPS
ncbi:MAG: Hpt domain-containing protein [Nitrospiraceae bacterium]|nr:Hpt domain-containing protein [Nitrospiraceae bacterium]